MFSSDVIFEHLKCFECNRYLSVKPIKVYPDRKVKCGRCATDNDGGTVSYLYETVVKNIQFPCSNRFKGCQELVTTDTVKLHEKICMDDNYDCILCDFRDTSYNLNFHIGKAHIDSNLQNAEFVIDFDKSGQEVTYFYSNNSPLLHIFYKYDTSDCQLFLNICCLDDLIQGDRTYSIQLCTINNKIIFKSNRMQFAHWLLFRENGFTFDITENEYSKNLAVCRFEVHNPVLLTIPQSIANTSESHMSFLVTFTDMIQLEDICYSTSYSVNGIWWKFYLKRVFRGSFISVNLLKDNGPPCCIAAVVTLLPNDPKKEKIIDFKRTFYDLKHISDKTIGFLKWRVVVISEDYLVENSLTFIIHLGVHNTNIELEQCQVCKVTLNSVLDTDLLL